MNSNINLLPVAFRKRLLVWARIRQWMIVNAVIVLAMSCWGGNEYLRMLSEKNNLAQLNEKALPVRKISQANLILTKRSQELLQKQKSISRIKNSDAHLQVLGVISLCTKPMRSDLHVVYFKLEEGFKQQSVKKSPSTNRHVPVAPKLPHKKGMRLDLKGFASSDETISEFVAALKAYECFDAVELKIVNRVEISSRVVRSYQIECTL